MKPEVIDNFLGKKEFDDLQVLMMGSDVYWSYTDEIDYKGQEDVDKFQFVHMFYYHATYCSQLSEILKPTLEIINPISLWRIKANLSTRTPKIVENVFHIDMNDLSKEKLKQWTTSIFYINTNNGYTEFEDGTQVESVANRLVTFSTNLKHRGTTCTDQKKRVVINFNYFSRYS